MSEKVFTVSQVSAYVKYLLKNDAALTNINIEGELSEYKLSGGNAYFTIKEESAALSCIFFGMNRVEYIPEIGDKVVINAKCDFYEKTGRLSFIASEIKPAGQGDILRQYQILKDKLEHAGYFDVSHKKPIPRYPQRIGVVTAETGAVIRDIVNIATRRNPNVDIVLYPAKVQGKGSEDDVIEGIDFFDNYNVDTVIIARGGGSIEDLAPFYSEKLALKVYTCQKPIISAIGHETDFVLCDFTADMRAPTPSAAAELAVPKVSELITEVENTLGNINYYIENKIRSIHAAYSNMLLQLSASSENARMRASRNVEQALSGMYNRLEGRINAELSDITDKLTLASSGVGAKFDDSERRMQYLTGILNGQNPLKLLERGYMKAVHGDHEISSVSDVTVGDDIRLLLHDGTLMCNIKEKGDTKNYGI